MTSWLNSRSRAGCVALLPAAALFLTTGCATTSNESAQLMFVQTAEDVRIDTTAKIIRLVRTSPQTLYFSDRPVRIAGHMPQTDYLKEWTAAAGPNNFEKDPPNATLSVFEPGQPDSTLAVVEIMNPKVDGADLVYGYRLIDGTLPARGGQSALFIDWIGIGGGVGRGFHGIGIGRRGPGYRGW